MKKILITLIAVIFTSGMTYAGDKMIVSGHFDRAPFDWQDGEKIAGAAIEIIGLIFKELEIETESKYVGPWKRVLLNLEMGEIDIMCGLYETAERKKFAEFTAPFSEDRVSIFVWHERIFNFETWDDLKGKRFGDIHGATRGKKFDEWRKKHATVEYVRDNMYNMLKLEKDRIDCFVTSHYPGLMSVEKHGYKGKIVPLDKPVKMKYLRFGISKKSKYIKCIPQINKRLKKLRENGTIEKIIQKNLDFYISAHLNKKIR